MLREPEDVRHVQIHLDRIRLPDIPAGFPVVSKFLVLMLIISHGFVYIHHLEWAFRLNPGLGSWPQLCAYKRMLRISVDVVLSFQRVDSDLELSVSNFKALILALLRDPAEKAYFFQVSKKKKKKDHEYTKHDWLLNANSHKMIFLVVCSPFLIFWWRRYFLWNMAHGMTRRWRN